MMTIIWKCSTLCPFSFSGYFRLVRRWSPHFTTLSASKVTPTESRCQSPGGDCLVENFNRRRVTESHPPIGCEAGHTQRTRLNLNKFPPYSISGHEYTLSWRTGFRLARAPSRISPSVSHLSPSTQCLSQRQQTTSQFCDGTVGA